jgi:predicted DNA binding CopG/RHH family protein
LLNLEQVKRAVEQAEVSFPGSYKGREDFLTFSITLSAKETETVKILADYSGLPFEEVVKRLLQIALKGGS